MAEAIELKAQPGRQHQFLSSPADIAIYGGAAGGGKTWGLLLEPLRHIHNREFGAIIFRRTYPQITMQGGLWDDSAKIYPLLGAESNSSDLTWRFPSGARVTFRHMQYEATKLDYLGAQVPLIGWDQLEQFSETQFFYLLARNRSTSGVRPYVRGTCNPDATSFLRKLLDWWIAEDGYADLSRAGLVRWFARVNEELVWADSAAELVAAHPQATPKSLTYIPASVYDNDALLRADPGYVANLKALPLVERERLLGDAKRGGNWNIVPTAGKIFNRAWFEIVEAAPAGGVECRFWDFAATAKALAGDDPDFTAGVLMRKVAGVYYVCDCIAEQEGPAAVDRLFKNTTMQDALRARQSGTQYRARWELEPGAAAIRENRRLVQMLDGLDAKGVPTGGKDKYQRAKPFAIQAQAGNVKLVKGKWNEAYLTHMHNQPDLPHDDIMDASGGAHNELSGASATRDPRTYPS